MIVGVDIHVDEGEMVALLRANNAVKTTTVLAASGVIGTVAGTLTTFGQPGRRSLCRRAQDALALLPEERVAFMTLTIRQNLELGRGSIDRALFLFPGRAERLDVRAGLCSGGEQQILALARFLEAGSRLILADELSMGLAPLVVKRLLQAPSAARRQAPRAPGRAAPGSRAALDR
jgi:branched-chain amino acid transport system ATP-binding protein